MSLTAQFAGEFDSAILHRGADYFRNGRVNIDSASASRMVAIVRGSSRYRVELNSNIDGHRGEWVGDGHCRQVSWLRARTRAPSITLYVPSGYDD